MDNSMQRDQGSSTRAVLGVLDVPSPQQCMETQMAQEVREDSPHVPSLSPATLQVRALLQTAQIFFSAQKIPE